MRPGRTHVLRNRNATSHTTSKWRHPVLLWREADHCRHANLTVAYTSALLSQCTLYSLLCVKRCFYCDAWSRMLHIDVHRADPGWAGLGRVLGRFINDTWPAPAGPLYTPVRPRFSRAGPGFRPDQCQMPCFCCTLKVQYELIVLSGFRQLD